MSTTRTMTVKAAVQVPTVPNFLLLEDGQKLPLSAFSDAGLRGVAKEWGEAMVARKREQVPRSSSHPADGEGR